MDASGARDTSRYSIGGDGFGALALNYVVCFIILGYYDNNAFNSRF